MRWLAGTTAELTVDVTRANGDRVDPNVIHADIYNPAGLIVDDGIPTRVGPGYYRYDYAIPLDAEPGIYRVEWQVTIDGQTAFSDEVFDVDEPDAPPVIDAHIAQLRIALSERIPVGKTAEDTAFSDVELAMVWNMGNRLLERAAAIGWSIKGGDAVELIDINENGSDRKLSQIYDHCRRQFQFWDTAAATIERALVATGVHRVVGVASDIWSQEEFDNQVSLYADGKMDTMYVRAYPLKRFPAVLGA